MQKNNFKPQPYSSTNTHWYEILLIKVETRFVFYYYYYRDSIKQKWQPLQYLIKRNWLKILIVALTLGVLSNYTFLNLKQSIGNIEANKSSLLEKIKLIIGKNNQDQFFALSEIEDRLISDLEPITNNPIFGAIVKSDISKVKILASRWLDILYPFKSYEFGIGGFESTLPQQKYFTQDVELFFAKSKILISQTRSELLGFWIYNMFGNIQVKDTLQTINNFVDILDILGQKQDIILTILGHYQSQKIVIFNQNTGEARPTGGFMGSYIPIDISRGQLKIGQSQSIYFFDKGAKSNIISHPAFWYYGFFEGKTDPHGIRNSNVFPCFPDTARLLEREFAKTENGYNIDDVVLISPDYLLGYLPKDFELMISQQKVPKDQILKKIEQITALEIEDINNPKKQITSIFSLIIRQLPEILRGQALVDLISYTQESLQARNIYTWFRSDKIQKLWQTTGMAGSDTCQNVSDSQIISPLIINLSGDKRNLISSTSFDIKKDNNSLKIKWTQTLPVDRFDSLQRGYNRDGIVFVGFQIPLDWKIKNINSNNKLKVPFLRDYYIQQLETENQTNYYTPPEIQAIINSSFDLSLQNNDQGFSYLQPDGSQVVGLYIYDNFDKGIASSELELEVGAGNYQNILFCGQPGLNNPVLNFNDETINNKTTIQKGFKIANINS